MSLKLNSSGGGSVTLQEPTTASNVTLNLPAADGTVVSTASTAVVTPAMLTQPLTSATAVASTSGTAIDFTSIPSWAKRITVMLNGVSTNGSSNFLIQIGTSGGVETSGYLAYFGFVQSTSNINASTSSTGFGVWHGGGSDIHYLPVVLHLVSGNTWIQSHAGAFWNGASTHMQSGSGNKTLGGTLDRVRITANGIDTFDAGSINILYEG
jgi:hypothetical protein